MIVTREQAICRLFCEAYTSENVKKCTERLQKMEEFDICYLEDPKKPVLMFKPAIYASDNYTLYTDEPDSGEEVNQLQLRKLTMNKFMGVSNSLILFSVSVAQIIQFINEVFVPYNPHNKVVYCQERFVSTAQIYQIVTDKSLQSFVTWCSKKKLRYLLANKTRSKENVHRTREMFVMREKFRGNFFLGGSF